MRSRRSSRPSWSSSALTFEAAGSLSTTPVAPGAPPSTVVVSCTDMLCGPPRSEGARCGTSCSGANTAVAVALPLPTVHCTAPRASSRACCVTHVDFWLVKLRLPGRRDRAETSDATSRTPRRT